MGSLLAEPPDRMVRSNARGQRTRQVIVDALLALVADCDLRPTVPRVAERAQLSLRSVFHHFNEVEVLLVAALAAAASFATWEWLRLRLGLTPELARRTMHRMLAAQVAFGG